MPQRATLTRADEVFVGNVERNGTTPEGRPGVKVDVFKHIDLGVPVTASTTNILATTPTSATLTLTVTALTSTVLDVPRNLQLVAAAAATNVVRVTGKDQYGEPLSEDFTLTGTTAVAGNKAFKSVSQVVIQPGAATTLSIGSGEKLGLPYRLSLITDTVGGLRVDNVLNATAVFVTGLATTVTSTAGTGDIRGTVTSTGSPPNNARRYTILQALNNISDSKVVYGVAQFA